MINIARRTTLKLLSSSLALSAVASSATALAAPLKGLIGEAGTPVGTEPQPLTQEATDLVFSIEPIDVNTPAGNAVVTIANNSDKAAVIRHIQPGIVAAHGTSYDLNVLVKDSPLTLAAGDVIRLPVVPVSGIAIETSVPVGFTPGQPVVVKTPLNGSSLLNNVQTVRTLYA